MKNIIVKTDVICVDADGKRHPISIQIGKPHLEKGAYVCEYRLKGIYDNLAPMRGEDSFQALMLAVGMVRTCINILKDKKYAFHFPDDNTPFDPNDAWFPTVKHNEH